MRHQRRRSLFACVAGVLLLGCGGDPRTSAIDPSTLPANHRDFIGSDVRLETTELEGDIADVVGIEHPTSLLLASDRSNSFQPQTYVDRGNGQRSAMTQVLVPGGLGRADLVPGSTLHFQKNGETVQVGEVLELTVDDKDPHGAVIVAGCAGDSPGHYDYDHQADDVTVTVASGPAEGARVLRYVAHWNETLLTPSRTVSGSFQYHL